MQDRGHIRSAQRASLLVAGKGDENRLPADAAHGKNRGAGFGHGHHRLDHEQVHPGFLEGRGLLRVGLNQFLKADVSQRREEMPGRRDVSRDQRLPRGCPTGQRSQSEVKVLHRVPIPLGFQLDAVCTEGRRIDHIAPGLNVSPLNPPDHVRMFQDPGFRAVSPAEPVLLEFGAGGSVQNQGEPQFHSSSSSS